MQFGDERVVHLSQSACNCTFENTEKDRQFMRNLDLCVKTWSFKKSLVQAKSPKKHVKYVIVSDSSGFFFKI